MTIKPWREVAHPHKDVLEGTFKQSDFAADISQVHAGTAPLEYQDAEMFFARTFITEGMRLLLQSVAERLSGRGGRSDHSIANRLWWWQNAHAAGGVPLGQPPVRD